MSQKKGNKPAPGSKIKPTTSRIDPTLKQSPYVKKDKDETTRVPREKQTLLFTRENYKWILIGLGTMILGFLLMSGGKMPDANTWEPERIYSFRRITLAPMVILVGLVIEVYAVFVGARKSSF
ncbi:MAG TPA: DUF3098 domain-containing protein [Saprospiraceae bacterium]|nr:DUF3098 domain-containing protein [Saprospiraceae bacterium]HQW56826.1 DUF3098 domain-containing protein [Saprospiraceae bacterium]